MINITGIINKIQLQIIDNSVATRSRLLAWTNLTMQNMVKDRDWEFLKTSISVTPANNQIDLSALTGYDRIYSFRNDSFCLYDNARASDLQVTIEQNNVGTSIPQYFREASAVFTFYPGLSNDAVIATYIKTFTDYTDNSATTIFPDQTRSALMRAVLTTYYEFDSDDRMMASAQLAENEMRKLRDWDNRLKPQPQYDNIIGGRNYYNV